MSYRRVSIGMLLAIVPSAVAGAGLSAAQNWPTQPISRVVPFSPGGPTETPGRILAARMNELLGQQVVIENVGGAGGIVGSGQVTPAQPDGCQMLYGNIGTHAQNEAVRQSEEIAGRC